MADKFQFNVKVNPAVAMALIKDGMGTGAELLHEELNNVGEGRMIGTLVYERYFLRSGNQAAMVIIADNLQGVCNIRLISAGSSNSMIFKVDWGAGRSFASSVAKILSEYTIE
ncbi:hypothetical protein R70723_14985 [Paenibacillus sp. FSL R7-0273]|uniref:DUF6054 family protein n=1 Tax=Paenibacillus sp. FSL R7-0273 TaxID=1536772 RepID=UPI0004F61F80|nr:DUF6054 family protein [Paenibacillus sp. FSL R7-0273]AIQ47039.1 hypothetical protein R70723_14985 [Paenibacillus sp. FSL R7-0273]